MFVLFHQLLRITLGPKSICRGVLSVSLAVYSVIRQWLQERTFQKSQTLDTFDFAVAEDVDATQLPTPARGQWRTPLQPVHRPLRESPHGQTSLQCRTREPRSAFLVARMRSDKIRSVARRFHTILLTSALGAFFVGLWFSS
jgi:hypothetical protein